MGLFDSLRSKRTRKSNAGQVDPGAQPSAPVDVDWFKPRTDGIYVGAATESLPYLRVSVNGRVQETWSDQGTAAARAVLAVKSDHRAEGEFSRGGLMSVVRRFERPVVYAVQDSGFVAAENGLFESFTARCTNTNTRETTIISFNFSPDGG